MSITFSEEPGSGDPKHWELTSPWRARWAVLCERLAAAAEARGGTSLCEEFEMVLQPPDRGQSAITVANLGPQSAVVEVGDVRLPVNWELGDDNPNATLEKTVYAIMDNDIWIEAKIRIADGEDGAYLGVVGRRSSAWS